MFPFSSLDLDDFFLPNPDCCLLPPSKATSIFEVKPASRLQDLKKNSKKKHWKPHENQKYIAFLKENKNLFEKDREDKRLMKINMMMSKSVRTKNATQCRSHHQKMLVHYKTIENIILFLGDEKPEQLEDEGESLLESTGAEMVEEHNQGTIQEEPKCAVNEDLLSEYERWFNFWPSLILYFPFIIITAYNIAHQSILILPSALSAYCYY